MRAREMTKKSLTDVVRVMFDELSPFDSDERKRAVQAVMTLLGEEAIKPQQDEREIHDDGAAKGLNARVKSWMRLNSLSMGQLEQTFHIENGGIEVIATVPGKNNKEKVRNAYVLFGVAHFIMTGEQRFDDAGARELCERYGFYDPTNHAKYFKDASEFGGSKERGWILTPAGMKQGAELIASLAR